MGASDGPVDGSTPESPDHADHGLSADGSGSSATTTTPVAGSHKGGFFSSHKAVTALAVIFVLLAGSAGGYLWWLNQQLGNVPRVDAGITTAPEKEGSSNETKYPLNILLLGADHGNVGQSVAEDLADGKWTPGVHLSDTIMVAHIPANRNTVQLLSIPRDTWTRIDGYPSQGHHAKINAAFSYGGPALAVDTVEQLTGISIDHLAIIDWVGFKDLTTALGGVRVYIPHTFYDDSQKTTWEQGWQELDGERALQYVRTRHGLTNGDFDRIKRQQNFMRSTMAKLLSNGTTSNPVTFGRVVKAITSNLTVDSSWDNGEIRSLAWSMRDIGTEEVQFVTAPLGRYDTTPDGESIVRLAKKQSEALFRAVRNDNISGYLDQYPHADTLGSDKKVN